MKNRKVKSLDQLFKVEDTSLKTPEHDEMVLWLLNSSNLGSLFPVVARFMKSQPVLLITTQWNVPIVGYSGVTLLDFVNGLLEKAKSRGIDVDFWEGLRAVGPDFLAEYTKSEYERQTIKSLHGALREIDNNPLQPRKLLVKSEEPIKNDKGFLVGYWDIRVTFVDPIDNHYWFDVRWNAGSEDAHLAKQWRTLTLNIEVKPHVRSFGEVLRQLNTYKLYSSGEINLFTKDRQFDAAFQGQGITVLHPPRAGE